MDSADALKEKQSFLKIQDEKVMNVKREMLMIMTGDTKFLNDKLIAAELKVNYYAICITLKVKELDKEIGDLNNKTPYPSVAKDAKVMSDKLLAAENKLADLEKKFIELKNRPVPVATVVEVGNAGVAPQHPPMMRGGPPPPPRIY